MIPVKRFSEYQREVWETSGSLNSIGCQWTFGNSQAILHSGPPSLVQGWQRLCRQRGWIRLRAELWRRLLPEHERAAEATSFETGIGRSLVADGIASAFDGVWWHTIDVRYAWQWDHVWYAGLVGVDVRYPNPMMNHSTASMYGMPPMLSNPLAVTHSPAGSDIGMSMPLSQQNTGGNMWGQQDLNGGAGSPSAQQQPDRSRRTLPSTLRIRSLQPMCLALCRSTMHTTPRTKRSSHRCRPTWPTGELG